jgi:hypothetical protein
MNFPPLTVSPDARDTTRRWNGMNHDWTTGSVLSLQSVFVLHVKHVGTRTNSHFRSRRSRECVWNKKGPPCFQAIMVA